MLIGLLSSKNRIEEHFEVGFSKDFKLFPNYSIRQEEKTLLISSDTPRKYSLYQYGFIPFWSSTRKEYFEAPVEGELNPYDNPIGGVLKKRIILHPAFRLSIREKRCLIPADYFIVQSESNIPYLFYQLNKERPFALAGIWDQWKENIKDELSYRFAILTMPAPKHFNSFGIKRLPLLLPKYFYKKWLSKSTPLTDVTSMLGSKFENLNAYPIRTEILYSEENEKKLIMPAGKPLLDDKHLVVPDEHLRNKKSGSLYQRLQESRWWRGR